MAFFLLDFVELLYLLTLLKVSLASPGKVDVYSSLIVVFILVCFFFHILFNV